MEVSLNKTYLTQLHPERPKLYTILAFLSAIGLKDKLVQILDCYRLHCLGLWDVIFGVSEKRSI